MTAVQGMERPRPERGGRRLRAAGARLFGGLAGRYRALKRRLADMLMRGDRDYAMLSALTQEIGRMRQRIRAEMQARRDKRKRKGGARKAPPALVAARGNGHDP